MPIPDYETIMLPVLEFLNDGKERTKKEIVDYIANYFKLDKKERDAEYEKSKTNIIYSKVSFAETYLNQALLIEKPRVGVFKIAKRGLEVLRNTPSRIDVVFLNQFNEFQEFRGRRRNNATRQTDNQSEEKTPEDLLEEGYHRIKDNLAQELLSLIKAQTPKFLERMVVELLLKMGYGGSFKDAGIVVGMSGDEGFDGVIKEDKLGLDLIYIQAKRYNTKVVGSPEIREFIGSLSIKNAKKGVFITTSKFTEEAQKCINTTNKVVLIDGGELVDLMIEYGVGVQKSVSYEIKKIDKDYFEEYFDYIETVTEDLNNSSLNPK